jgi:hypothetical protein
LTPPASTLVTRSLAALLVGIAAAGCGGGGLRSPAQAGGANVALGRPASVVGSGQGDTSVVTDGRLATEGTAPGEAAVTLADVRSAIVVDLGAPRPVRALLLQAAAADVYFVEVSDDGSSWRVVWRVAPLDAAVLRTRTTVLPRSTPARYLRVRPTTARAAAVSELQAFEAEPAAWPRLDMSAPGSSLPLWPRLTRERTVALFQALAALLMLVSGWSLLARRVPGGRVEERVRRGALVALALLSLVAWPNLLNFHYYGFVHKWDVFHYYMGAKYLPELGYTRLYACTAVVDAEDGLDLHGYTMRDLRDNREVPALSLLDEAPACRARFSTQRWKAFESDTRFFRTALGHDAWIAVRSDHGFNGTPAWAVAGGLLARLGPASWPLLRFLALLDVVLMLLAFVLLGRTFGLEAACLAAGYWGLNSLSQWGWTGGGFLRCDWLLLLVAGVAALRTRRLGVAGFALAYAALLRVYPVFAIVGVGLKAVADAAAGRHLEPLWRYRRFAAGAVTAVAVLLASSVLLTGRAGIWREFADNSAKHLATESVNLVGLEVLLTYQHDTRVELMTDPLRLDRYSAWRETTAALARRTRVARWAAGTAFCLLLTLAARGAPDWVAAILGLGLVPMLVKAAGYYYAMLLLYAALWPVAPGAGFALATFTWATTVIPGLWPDNDAQFAALSLAAVALATGLTAAFARHRTSASPSARPPEQGGEGS